MYPTGCEENQLRPWREQRWCIPAAASEAVVAAMEGVLDLYARPAAPMRPVVCVDETSQQHLPEMRPPLPPRRGKPYRYDPEYKRNGVSNLFMIFAPFFGVRHVEATDQRTSVDFAQICRDIVDVLFPKAEKMLIVCDNLNTHKPVLCIKRLRRQKLIGSLKSWRFTIRRSIGVG